MLRTFNSELRSANLAESARLNERSAWEVFAALRRVLLVTFGTAARVDAGPSPGQALTLPVSAADMPDYATDGFTEAPSVEKRTTGDLQGVVSTAISWSAADATLTLGITYGSLPKALTG